MSLYTKHLETVTQRFDKALEDNQFESVLVYAGQPRVAFLDDNPAPYKVNPLFKYWVPVLESPKSAVFYKKGAGKPIVICFKHATFGTRKRKSQKKIGSNTLI